MHAANASIVDAAVTACCTPYHRKSTVHGCYIDKLVSMGSINSMKQPSSKLPVLEQRPDPWCYRQPALSPTYWALQLVSKFLTFFICGCSKITPADAGAACSRAAAANAAAKAWAFCTLPSPVAPYTAFIEPHWRIHGSSIVFKCQSAESKESTAPLQGSSSQPQSAYAEIQKQP